MWLTSAMRKTRWRFEGFAQSLSHMRYCLALFVLLTSLPSCKSLELAKSLKPFSPDDAKASCRWLQTGRFDAGMGGQYVITDNEIVSESYQTPDRGRRRGISTLKSQLRLPISPEDATWFWKQVDRANVFGWTDADMPADTGAPYLIYRKGSKEMKLPVSKGTSAVEGSKHDALETWIVELQNRSQTRSIPGEPKSER